MRTIEIEIDSTGWPYGFERERDTAENKLREWFEGLSKKSQLGIYYAQQHVRMRDGVFHDFDPLNGDCPWLNMVEDAENRIFLKYTKGYEIEGCNFFLSTRPMYAMPKEDN